jgi:hypothetical protein
MRAGSPRSGFRQAALGEALDRAVKKSGDTAKLYDLLARASGLPGIRTNEGVVQAFAAECAARGPAAHPLVAQLVKIDADVAAGNSAFEILPICGAAAACSIAQGDETQLGWALGLLHDAADDLRYRVRDEVCAALARLGETFGDKVIPALDGWMDGYFHAAAVLTALGDRRFESKLASPELTLDLLDKAFALAKNAERAAARYPGYKALLEVLGKTPATLASRFGVPAFARLEVWATAKDPVLRDIVARNLQGKSGHRFADAATRVKAVLEKTTPERRDPRTYVGPTRGRGRKAQAKK